jgi:Protein of unknown function (DUF3134)
MVTRYSSPALREEPRNQRTKIIFARENESLYQWIRSTGRFKPREPDEETSDPEMLEELEDIMETSIYEQEKEEEAEESYL